MVFRRLVASFCLCAFAVSHPNLLVAADTTAGPAATLDAAIEWMSAHPTNPASDRVAYVTFDVWTWDVIARLHPSGEVRKRAADEIASRLTRLQPPQPPTGVLVSYWSVLLRLMEFHGHVDPRYREAAAKADLEKLLEPLAPTTVWWTLELLRYSGLPTKPSFKETFIAKNTNATTYEPKAKDVYRVFHEIVPSSDLGRQAPRLTEPQAAFVRHLLPPAIRMSREEGDTDGVAEGLVSASLIGTSLDEVADDYRWLLAQQRSDGTFRARRDTQAARDAHHFRHVMIVGTWAVATQLKDTSSGGTE